MAEPEKNMPLSTVRSRFSFFNRSQTMHSNIHTESFQKSHLQGSLDRTGSMNKLYNPMESMKSAGSSLRGKVKKLCNLFETGRITSNGADERIALSPSKLKPTKTFGPGDPWNSSISSTSSWIRLPGTEDRIVLYLTSLRGIRRTYEDCYAVRMIFMRFCVWVDERDISMDAEYRKELQRVMGEKNVSLPQVFIRGKYLGGADVIKHLFEVGELAKILEGIPKRKPGFVCMGCGDVRFVPCTNCSGSRKIFEEDEGMLQRCVHCNENGLIRCSDCCS
ncbi:hypothetical protein L6164_017863 [Bauhinia variegata]|uniref:Uncharacterized protein n=1 Tax=Bauhinia variegata TaxID=167791 RepID=A0ACB9N9Y1_BAUVA|nr:hypothetical protein L6164_017863 [Bauhinia variegata]